MAASFGALTGTCEPPEKGRPRSRYMNVEVRVGDYARDNTNFFVPITAAGVVRPLLPGGMTVPIDDSYDEIRRRF